jgi:hypothetical protein
MTGKWRVSKGAEYWEKQNRTDVYNKYPVTVTVTVTVYEQRIQGITWGK